jgi:hypothetical protein
MAANNENAILFRAYAPSRPANSGNLNVTVGDATQRDAFSEAAANDIAAIVRELCTMFEGQLRAAGGSGGCLSHELVTLEARGALVIHQSAQVPAAGLDNHRVVAMIPASGLLFTLSLSFERTVYDAGLVRALLASVRFPEGL